MASPRLILMRHAKSDWSSGERDDFLRPLNARGVRDARRMGAWLARSGYLPAAIVSSPSRRTRDTLSLLAEGAGCELAARTRFESALYPGSPQDLRAALRASAVGSEVMLLAHNPGLEELLSWLLPRAALPARHTKRLPTGAVYVLELDAGYAALRPGCARLIAAQRPRALEP